jgi:hypothetical protein
MIKLRMVKPARFIVEYEGRNVTRYAVPLFNEYVKAHCDPSDVIGLVLFDNLAIFPQAEGFSLADLAESFATLFVNVSYEDLPDENS